MRVALAALTLGALWCLVPAAAADERAACPVSPRTATPLGKGLGAGPAYPRLGTGTTLRVGPPVSFGSSSWGGAKVLWFVLPSYTGPVVIRGERLDGPGKIGFDQGDVPVLKLTIQAGEGARYRPSYTRIQKPGCYAYHVVGTSFHRTIVFRAVRTY